jgi:lysozyme family protein
MASFELAYQRTNAFEGSGLSDHKSDLGGLTYAGIARKKNPQWTGWGLIDSILDRGAFDPLPHEHKQLRTIHAQFFRDTFWSPLHLSSLNSQAFADEVYDTAVNCGPGRAVEWFQKSLNVANRRGKLWADIAVDDDLGPATVGAANRAADSEDRAWLVLKCMEAFQAYHYVTLAMSTVSQEDNMLGWFRHRIQH